MTSGTDGRAADRTREDGPPTEQVHVADLLAAHGRAVAPSGRRRRREEAEDAAVLAPAPVVTEAPPTEVAPLTAPEPAPAPEPVAEPVVPEPVVPEPVVPGPVVPELEPPPGAEPVADPQPLRAWGVVLVQLVGALVVGAALWFGFRSLWQAVPVLAAVLATVLTLALVVGVRVVRRDTDHVTAALALLAGLVVTFSPPLLSLTSG